MKKVLAFLLCLSSVTSIVAQPHHGDYSNNQLPDRNSDAGLERNDQRDYTVNRQGNYGPLDHPSGNRAYDKSFTHIDRERSYRIERIKRDYDYKISSVIHNRYISNREKKHIVRNLENEKWERIREINFRYRDTHYGSPYGKRNGRY